MSYKIIIHDIMLKTYNGATGKSRHLPWLRDMGLPRQAVPPPCGGHLSCKGEFSNSLEALQLALLKPYHNSACPCK